MKGLMLHAGGRHVSRAELHDVRTPDVNQDTGWTPIAHHELVDQTLGTLERAGYTVTGEDYGLWGKDAERFFAVFQLLNGGQMGGGDMGLAMGLANSHDQSICARLAFGVQVFVCDNLSFSAEITIARKHTRHIYRDLPGLLADRLQGLRQFKALQENRIERYRATELTTVQVHDLVVRAFDARVIAGGKIDDVLREYRQPRHPEFAPRTAWSLHNAFTEVLKSIAVIDLPRRTRALDTLLDGLAVAV